MFDRKYYVICADNCKFEGMTKEQILAAITQAVEGGKIHDVDTGFVTKLVEQNAKRNVTLWVGTRAQYNAIATPAKNCLYIITDDTTAEDFDKAIKALQERADEAERKAAESKAVDFSEAVTIAGADGLRVDSKKFLYDPTQGIAHFSMMLTYTGSMATGSFSADIELGKYKPKAGAFFPLATFNGGKIAQGSIGRPMISGAACKLQIQNETEVNANDSILISGWYFAEV